jgi:hypothetical protein
MSVIVRPARKTKRRCDPAVAAPSVCFEADRQLDDIDLGREVARDFETNGLLADLRFVPNLHWDTPLGNGILLLETHFCADLYLKCGELNPSLPITLAFAGRASNGAGNGPTLGSLNRVAQGGHLSKGVLQESAALPI